MSRYFVSVYTDGPATRWNVIDRQTQEWVRRFATEAEASQYAAALSTEHRGTEAMGRKPKPTYVEDEPLFNVDIWNHVGDVVRHYREVTAAEVEDIRDQYDDEPTLDVVVEETR